MSQPPPDRRPPTGGRVTFLVARREFMTRVRSRFFQVGTAILVVVLCGYIVVQGRVINKSSSSVDVGFVGQATSLAAPLATAARASDTSITTSTVADEASGERAVQAGSLDALVSGSPTAPTVTVKDKLDPTTGALLNSLVRVAALNQALTARGVDPAAVDTAVAGATIHVVTLDPSAGRRTSSEVAGIFISALLYTALVVYGQFVAQGVVEEKANRIIEILLSAVRPRQLLFGKVAGIGLVGLLQLVIVGLAALLTVRSSHAVSLPNVGITTVLLGLMFFVLGFLFFSLIYAAAGSLVSRQEDIPPVTTPITVLVVGIYLAFFWVLANPTKPLAATLSMLPGFAPIIMPSRIATGDASWWQVVVAVALSTAGIAVLNALAARIYANSVVRTGARVSLREAWSRRP